jgi:hypothetical protein
MYENVFEGDEELKMIVPYWKNENYYENIDHIIFLYKFRGI